MAPVTAPVAASSCGSITALWDTLPRRTRRKPRWAQSSIVVRISTCTLRPVASLRVPVRVQVRGGAIYIRAQGLRDGGAADSIFLRLEHCSVDRSSAVAAGEKVRERGEAA